MLPKNYNNYNRYKIKQFGTGCHTMQESAPVINKEETVYLVVGYVVKYFIDLRRMANFHLYWMGVLHGV